ncbi:hypothetical protein ISN45_Aa04g012030 [Arabidopsis thaliana x Arabidopsis arenosa]|uniref:Transmembrane protein n=1 Tax=Arabidopsis thaliana x Arabidopsis arenosa TaxID=1240361 RepID=A0A8T2A7G8_9BRAS|nr:hypothetical protein ISN45_Aa04g012030 [Arabidopsis thaliana x Arabidopsis arenosa]
MSVKKGDTIFVGNTFSLVASVELDSPPSFCLCLQSYYCMLLHLLSLNIRFLGFVVFICCSFCLLRIEFHFSYLLQLLSSSRYFLCIFSPYLLQHLHKVRLTWTRILFSVCLCCPLRWALSCPSQLLILFA